MSFDVELEKDVLSSCMKDVAFMRAAAPVLREHLFSSTHFAWVWRVLASSFEAARELPTGRIYAAHLARDYETETDRAYMMDLLKSLMGRKPGAPKLALKELREFAQLAVVRRMVGDVMDGLDDGDLEAAKAAIESGLLDARSASALADPSAGIDWKDRRRRYAGAEGPGFRFEMPLARLTSVTNGGLPPGAVAIAVAQTNVGKSTWVVDVGFTALRIDPYTHVAHVTTEETEGEAFARYDARATGIERSRLLSGRLDVVELAKFDERMTRCEELMARLHVLELAPGSSSSGVWAFVERVREKAGKGAPILLIVDSPDHLEPPVKSKKENHRLSTAAVYWSLKAIVKEKELSPLATWVVTWAPAEYEKKKATANATSETKEKGRIADFMVHMSDGGGASTDEDEQEIVFDVVKNRVGRVKAAKVYSSANLGTCEFKELDSSESETPAEGEAADEPV